MADEQFITIAGSGLATPLGLSVEQTWNALMAGKHITSHAGLQIEGTTMRAQRAAMMVAREAIQGANWTDHELASDRTGLFIGTSKGSITDWLAPPLKSHKPLCRQRIVRRFTYGIDETAFHLHQELRMGMAPVLTSSAACASGLHALIRACLALRSGEIDRALVVSTEASMHELFLGSFTRLGVFPRPEIGCRPFDVHRDGFLMSECAGAICLEIQPEPAGWTRIDRFAMGGDPTSITGSDHEGTVLRYLLRQVVQDEPVDLMHAHGTGTPLNDPIELAAIEDSLADGTGCSIYSHKGALGHSLGAAGLVAVVLSDQMHRRRMILPNVQTRDPLPTTKTTIAREAMKRSIRTSVCIASGFGGASAVVRLS